MPCLFIILETNNVITTTEDIVTTHNNKEKVFNYIPYISGKMYICVISDVRAHRMFPQQAQL